MKIHYVSLISFLVVPLGCISSKARAQNLLNGSFEIGIDPNTGAGQNLGLFAPDSTTIFGWTLASGSIDYIGDRWAAGNGGRSIDLSGISAGSISQAVDGFTPGLTYELSFLMAANPEGGAPTKTLEVNAGGTSQIFTFTGPGSPTDMGWTERTLKFTAATSMVTMAFTSLDDNASGAALDRIRIVQVPEPSSWVLLVMGVCAVVDRRKRSRCR